MPASPPLDSPKSEPVPFIGNGTILYADIVRITVFPAESGPLAMLELMRRHQDFNCAVIQTHHGNVSQFIGSATVAYWLEEGPDSDHAARAFAAARQMLSGLPALLSQQGGAQYDIRVTLGSGELAGQFFGPIKQFQVVGQARAIADRLDRESASAGSKVRMSQYTADLLDGTANFVEQGRIARDGLADLRILEWTARS